MTYSELDALCQKKDESMETVFASFLVQIKRLTPSVARLLVTAYGTPRNLHLALQQHPNAPLMLHQLYPSNINKPLSRRIHHYFATGEAI